MIHSTRISRLACFQNVLKNFAHLAERSQTALQSEVLLYLYTYKLCVLYHCMHKLIYMYSMFFSACASAGTNLLTLHAPNEQVSANLIFNVKVTPNPHSVMFAINEKREISFHGCLDYEV